jgi:hypothetical protein
VLQFSSGRGNGFHCGPRISGSLIRIRRGASTRVVNRAPDASRFLQQGHVYAITNRTALKRPGGNHGLSPQPPISLQNAEQLTLLGVESTRPARQRGSPTFWPQTQALITTTTVANRAARPAYGNTHRALRGWPGSPSPPDGTGVSLPSVTYQFLQLAWTRGSALSHPGAEEPVPSTPPAQADIYNSMTRSN